MPITSAKTYVQQGYVISTNDAQREADIREIQLEAARHVLSLAVDLCANPEEKQAILNLSANLQLP